MLIDWETEETTRRAVRRRMAGGGKWHCAAGETCISEKASAELSLRRERQASVHDGRLAGADVIDAFCLNAWHSSVLADRYNRRLCGVSRCRCPIQHQCFLLAYSSWLACYRTVCWQIVIGHKAFGPLSDASITTSRQHQQ